MRRRWTVALGLVACLVVGLPARAQDDPVSVDPEKKGSKKHKRGGIRMGGAPENGPET